MSTGFLTVAEELLPVAETAKRFFSDYGYTLRIEHRDISFPFTPTLLASRKPTTLIVEVWPKLDPAKVRQWASYASSASRDTRFGIVLPAGATVQVDDLPPGVGLFRYDGAVIVEVSAPGDLAISVGLPELSRYPVAVRRAVGSAFEEIGRGNWRDGFGGVCHAVENEARKYLTKHIASGRIIVIGPNGRTITPSKEKINKMTLGALKDQFEQIVSPNSSDSLVASALARLNPDRILLAHKRGGAVAERKLRASVGQQIWVAIGVLDALLR